MAKKQTPPASEALNLIKTQAIPSLKLKEQFLNLIEGFETARYFWRLDTEADLPDEELSVMISIKKPFSLFSKKPYDKEMTLDIEKESYYVTFTLEDREVFKENVLEAAKAAMNENFPE